MKYADAVLRLALPALILAGSLSAQDRPNILWLTIEDISPHLGCYGFADAKTPVLDSLASKGLLFKNAFVTAPVCAVSRASLLTGMFSYTQGTHHMRNAATLSPKVKTYPELMRAAGYYCTNPGAKGDYQGLAQGSKIWDLFDTAIAQYSTRPDKSKPFLHVDNGNGCTHESCNQLKGQTLFDPAKLTSFPPYYPDTPKARAVWAQYYANISGMDKGIQTKLNELKASGESDNTIVFIYSDHGVGLPRAKRWAYESGLHIPLIVYVPPKWQRLMPYPPGSKVEELVSEIDFTATILNLAGIKLPDYMQGRSFLGSSLSPQRKYIHGHRDRMDERYEIIRTVRDARYKYIRNYEYWKPHQQFNAYAELNPWSGLMEEIRRVGSTTNPPPEISWYFQSKPVEELYDLQSDPNEMKDLARDFAYRGKLLELRAEHLRWRKESRDLGAIPEGIILERRKAYGNEYDYGLAKPQELERAWNVLDSLYLYTLDELIPMLGDKDGAVRYWAATGLANLIDRSKKANDALTTALNDTNGWVSVAAARGLLLNGDSQPALNAFKLRLADPNGAIVLTAVQAADDLGNRVASLKSEISAVQGWQGSQDVATRAIATLDDPPFIHNQIISCCPYPTDPGFCPNRTGDDIRKCKNATTLARKSPTGLPFAFRLSRGILTLELPHFGNYKVTLLTPDGRKILSHQVIGSNTYSAQIGSEHGVMLLEIQSDESRTIRCVFI
jgi:arylsulfatase A-like enzyme